MIDFLNTHAAVFYGACTIIALALSVLAKRETMTKIGLVLLLDWVIYNVIVSHNGFDRAPLLIPTFDATIGIWIGLLAWTHHDRIGAAVFGLFAVVVGWWCIEIWSHAQASFLCYLCANLLFLSQVALVGASSGWSYLADRRPRGRVRAHPHPARG